MPLRQGPVSPGRVGGPPLPRTQSCPATLVGKGLPISAAPSDAVPSRLLWRNLARCTFPSLSFPVNPFAEGREPAGAEEGTSSFHRGKAE